MFVQAIREANTGDRIPRETRICICGCAKTFEVKINSKKRFVRGHQWKDPMIYAKMSVGFKNVKLSQIKGQKK